MQVVPEHGVQWAAREPAVAGDRPELTEATIVVSGGRGVGSADKFSVVETVKTEFGAKTMALDPKTHNLFVDTSDFEQPPAGSKQQPRAIPGTFRLLIYGR